MPTIKKSPRRPWQPERKAHDRRIRTNEKFYHSAEWRKLRAVKIEQSPLCELCGKMGVHSIARVVDHIIPINQGGAPLDMDNLQSLCHTCHNKKSGEEAHVTR